jgi:uncharacterized membrane protein YciS (DUF1049 family)
MGSTRRAMCAAMLVLQAVVLGLTTPVMISVADVDVATALWVGLGLTFACILTAGMLRREWAYLVGWGIQVASLALGFVIPIMFALGVVFASLWAGAYYLGRKIDVEKAERTAVEERWAAEHADDTNGR